MSIHIGFNREGDEVTLHVEQQGSQDVVHVFKRSLEANTSFGRLDAGEDSILLYNKMATPLEVQLIMDNLLLVDKGGAKILLRLSKPIQSLLPNEEVTSLSLDFHMGIWLSGALTFLSAY